MYSSYSFTTSALDGCEWSASCPGRALPHGPPAPIRQEAGWSPERVWEQRLEEESFRLCRGLNHEVYKPRRNISVGVFTINSIKRN
jgi:hypothetical protein